MLFLARIRFWCGHFEISFKLPHELFIERFTYFPRVKFTEDMHEALILP